MFISKFSVEDWQGNQNRGTVQIVESWHQIEAAINQLDGQRKTLLTLETEGETHMAIGGGGNGQYVVYVTFDNESFHYVVEPANASQEQTLIVGGQAGDYPRKLCVDKAAAIQAAKTFAERGTMDGSVCWEQDGVFEPV